MSSTTIKVDSTVRDRLAILANNRGTTMGALLAEATDQLERETFFSQARRQLDELREQDPTTWSDDRAESRSWQAGTDTDILSRDDDTGWWE